MAENKTPIWYPTMSDDERTELQAAYKPEEHLISWDKGGEALIYYPSAWRLYELRLRFPEAQIDTDIYHFNEQSGFVILISYIYVGESYEKSKLRAKAFKQGYASKLDALQTMCESRAARNFGISPTLALDVDDTDIAKIAIRSEEEHQAKREAARHRSDKQGKATQQQQTQPEPTRLDKKRSLASSMAKKLKIDAKEIDSMDEESLDKFIQECRAKHKQAQASAPAPASEQAPARNMPTDMDGKRKLAHQLARKLKLSESTIDKMDDIRLQDFINNCIQENKLAQAAAKAEARAREEAAKEAKAKE